MASEYGYLQQGGTLRGPHTPEEIRELVADAPDADWRYSPDGLAFDDLPDWAREAPTQQAPSRVPLPLAPARAWPDDRAWHHRMVVIGSLGVLLGLLLPAVAISAGGPDHFTPLWTGLIGGGWHLLGLFALAILAAFGGALPIVAVRLKSLRDRAGLAAWSAGIAFFVYFSAEPPQLDIGSWLAEGIAYPPRNIDAPLRPVFGTESADRFVSAADDPPQGSRIVGACIALALALVAAGTRTSARMLGRTRHSLLRAGGLIALLGLFAPIDGSSLAEYVWRDYAAGGRPTFPTIITALVAALGLVAATIGLWIRQERTVLHVCRSLVYLIVLLAPLAAFATMADVLGTSPGLALAIGRDTLVVYGVLIVFASSVATWALRSAPYQPGPAPQPLGVLQRRQGTFAIAWCLLAVAPSVVAVQPDLDNPWGREDTRWLFERVQTSVSGDPQGPTIREPMGGLLWPIAAGLALILLSRLKRRRAAVVLALAVLTTLVAFPVASDEASLGREPLNAVSWSISRASDHISTAEQMNLFTVLPALSASLALLAAGALAGRSDRPAPGSRLALACAGRTFLLLGPLLLVAWSAGLIWIARGFGHSDDWHHSAISAVLILIALAAAFVPAPAGEAAARRTLIRRLAVPVFVACLVVLLIGWIQRIDGWADAGQPQPLLWVYAVRDLLGIAIMMPLTISWLCEALHLFGQDPTLRQEHVFE